MLDCEVINPDLLEGHYDVAVIMTCYNHAKYVRKALESVLCQKFSGKMLVIVYDDCSPDESRSIIQEYAEKNPDRLAFFAFKKNTYSKGISPFWDYFLPEINADYIAQCECDDYWLDDKRLEKQVEFLNRHKDCSCVTGNCYSIDENGSKFIHPPFTPQMDHDYTLDSYRFGNRMPGQTASKVFRLDIYKSLPDDCRRDWRAIRANGDIKLDLLCVLTGYIRRMSSFTSVYRKITSGGTSWSATHAGIDNSREMIRSCVELSNFAKKWFGVDIKMEAHIVKQLLKKFSLGCKEKFRGCDPTFRDCISEARALDESFFAFLAGIVDFSIHRMRQKAGIARTPINYDLPAELIQQIVKG